MFTAGMPEWSNGAGLGVVCCIERSNHGKKPVGLVPAWVRILLPALFFLCVAEIYW